METLTHICVTTEEAFKEFYSGMIHGALEKIAQEWIGDFPIISYKLEPGNKLIIVAQTESATEGPFCSDLYSVYRFFPGGPQNWNISADLQDASVAKLAHHLLTKKY